MQNDGAPRYTSSGTTPGLLLGAARHADDGALYWRIAQYLLPNHGYAPGTARGENYHGQTWVPIDDENCWVYTYTWNPERPLTDAERDSYATRRFDPRRGRCELEAYPQPRRTIT